MNTIPLAAVPNSLGAWDAMVARARSQDAINRETQSTLEQKKEWIRSDLKKLMAKEELGGHCLFLPRSKPVRADTVLEVLVEAAEYQDFAKKLVSQCFYAAQGMDSKEFAAAILEGLVDQVAESNAELMLD